jgi:hypothetical protein
MLKEIIKGYEKKFGKAIIFIAFTFVSLIVAVVLFGFLHSTGMMKLIIPGYVDQAEFGGALTGFLATLIILIREFNKPDELFTQELTLKGRVWDASGLPVADADVFATTAKYAEKTNPAGHFSVEVKPQKEWKVTATYQGQTVTSTVESNAINDFLELEFSKKKSNT